MLHLTFKRNSEAKKLTQPVREYLRHRFLLHVDYIDSLRCFEQNGAFLEKPVKQIRIYSPNLARKFGIVIRTKSDLEQHPEALLFIGHIDSQRQVYMADRRMPAKQLNIH